MTTSSTDLLRVVANELKLPLTNIQATSSMLSNDVFDDIEKEEQYKRLLINSEQAIEMIDALLLAGRVQTNQMSLDLVAVNVAGVVREVVAELDDLAARYDHNIRIQITDQLSPASANRTALVASIRSMMDSIIRSSKSEVIEVLIHHQLDSVMITVRDDGKPLNNQTVKNILKNLGKSVQPAKALPSTAGLGVYVSAVLMDAMGGKFDAYTVDNKRAVTFSLKQSEQMTLL